MPSLVFQAVNNDKLTGPLEFENISSSQEELLNLSRNMLNSRVNKQITKPSTFLTLLSGNWSSTPFGVEAALAPLSKNNLMINSTNSRSQLICCIVCQSAA